MKRSFVKFGAVVSLFAALAIFAHAGVDHSAGSDQAGHACAVCRITTIGVDSPTANAAPIAFLVEALACSETPGVTCQPSSLRAGRSPPSL